MQVSALFRHPIKSHGRERIKRVILSEGMTMPWDRHWAVTHENSKFDPADPVWRHCRNFMIGARTPGLAGIWAEFDERAGQITLRHQKLGDVTFDPDSSADFSKFQEWVTPLCPEGRGAPQAIVKANGRGMTDSDFPSISIMNIASHSAVADHIETPFELERWRGNIWIEGASAWAEHEWINRSLRIGQATLRIRERIERCTVTNTNPHTGERDSLTLSVLNEHFGHQDFGVYAEVTSTGEVNEGDKVELI